MPCLVAKNWAMNWLFRIGDPNSSVWLSSELKCGIQNQFRGTTPARPTYPFANSEVETSVFAPNRPVARSFSLPKNRRTKVRAILPCAGQGEDGGAARYERRLPFPLPSYPAPCPPSAPALPLPRSPAPPRCALPVEP